jgi:hypothetical protein
LTGKLRNRTDLDQVIPSQVPDDPVTRRMKQNIYDNPTFFQAYCKLRENDSGLNGLVEEPAIGTVLPDLRGLKVLDLGSGFGDFWGRDLAQDDRGGAWPNARSPDRVRQLRDGGSRRRTLGI